jgi:hypothetical protein
VQASVDDRVRTVDDKIAEVIDCVVPASARTRTTGSRNCLSAGDKEM